MPRAMNDSRKLIASQLAEYRRQAQAMADNFVATINRQNTELKTSIETHAKTTRQAAEQIRVRLAEAEDVARRVELLMKSAASDWRDIQTSTTAQCERWENASNDLQDRLAWRVAV
jgi:preprotein translocase subunit SecD